MLPAYVKGEIGFFDYHIRPICAKEKNPDGYKIMLPQQPFCLINGIDLKSHGTANS
jgi:hypothetical protein